MQHLGVRTQDLVLNCFMWGGKVFVELMCTFGCTSSPYHFNVVSDVVKEIACKNTGMHERDVNKCLDDAIPIHRRGTGMVRRYEEEYRRLCGVIGVRLASPEDGPGKTFSVCQKGEVLGIDYDLTNWTWNIPEAKMLRLLQDVKLIAESKHVSEGHLEMVAGKLNHYHPVVPGGKWERSWILRLLKVATWTKEDAKVDGASREQAQWWIAALQTCAGGTRIPDPRNFMAAAAWDVYTDAAGAGDWGEKTPGMGGVTWNLPTPTCMAWTQWPWPKWIREGKESKLGTTFAHKLTTLEGVAGLAQVSASHRELRGRPARLWCDNQGFVYAYQAGTSRCLYAATIAKALATVAKGLGIQLQVVKTGRMSGPGERAADALSKGDMKRADLDIGGVRERKPRKISGVIRGWIRNPTPDPELGKRILEELAGEADGEVLPQEATRMNAKALAKAVRVSTLEDKRARKKGKWKHCP